MRLFSTGRLWAMTMVLAALSVGLLGCPKQEDLPSQIDFNVPPTPSNFVVSLADTTDFVYTFEWAISSPGDVDRYRGYLVGAGVGGTDELLFETPNTSTTYTFGFSIEGLQFAVSAVGTNGVEGHRRVTSVQD